MKVRCFFPCRFQNKKKRGSECTYFGGKNNIQRNGQAFGIKGIITQAKNLITMAKTLILQLNILLTQKL